jgi:ArsR family transcriptional regulator, arsenate/arsenite/antimonite-responsive transcriptional repressor
MKELVKTLKVLSDETRIRILSLLLEKECCVCEVMQSLEISQSKASRGLTALYDVGLLKMKKNGLWSLYSLDVEGMNDYQPLLVEALKKALKDHKVVVLDRERLKTARRVGAGCAEKTCRTEPVSP